VSNWYCSRIPKKHNIKPFLGKRVPWRTFTSTLSMILNTCCLTGSRQSSHDRINVGIRDTIGIFGAANRIELLTPLFFFLVFSECLDDAPVRLFTADLTVSMMVAATELEVAAACSAALSSSPSPSSPPRSCAQAFFRVLTSCLCCFTPLPLLCKL